MLKLNFLPHDIEYFLLERELSDCEKQDYEKQYASLVVKGSVGRKNEFYRGRFCAHKALEQLSCRDTFVPISDGRAPLWPNGYCGSISHSKDMAIALAAKSDAYQSIGVDIERIVTEKRIQVIKRMTLTPAEVIYLESFADQSFVATIMFSAKEAFYKYLNPVVGEYINFHEGIIQQIDCENQSFQIELVSDKERLQSYCRQYLGSYQLYKDQVITSLFSQ